MTNKLFTFGRPAKGEGFTDREKETERLVSNFRYGINTFIVSPRRWGKTSLVLKAMDIAKTDKLIPVFVDIFDCKNENQFCEKLSTAVLTQTSSKLDEVMEYAKAFLSRITFDIGLSPDALNPLDLKLGLSSRDLNKEDVLMLPQRIAEKKKIEIVVCIDEFQQIGEFKDSMTLQRTLRTSWQHQDNVTYCLFGSRKHMMEALFDSTDKPFYKFGDIIYLDSIPVSYWIEFIQKRFASEGKEIPAEICQKICECVEFNSSYIQQLSWYLFQETGKVADMDGLNAALDELIVQNAPVFETRIEPLTAYQLNLLRAVADGVTSGFSTSHIVSKYKLGSSANAVAIMKVLMTKDYIYDTSGGIKMTDPVMSMWLRRYC